LKGETMAKNTMPNLTNDWYTLTKARPIWGRNGECGTWPTLEQLNTAHVFGKAGKQSLALAMAMRPEGVTNAQIVQACGASQNNHRVKLVRDLRLFDRVPANPNHLNHTVYKIELNKAGAAEVAKKTARTDKLPGKHGKHEQNAAVKTAPVIKAKAKVKLAKKLVKKAKADLAQATGNVAPEQVNPTPNLPDAAPAPDAS
jgi:hypothetical protein